MTDSPPRSLRPLLLPGLVAVLIAFSCSGKGEAPPPPRTPAQQRTVDSTIGASALPGSGGVQGALRAQDSAAARPRQIDSLMKAP
jgi:hypothetical protein